MHLKTVSVGNHIKDEPYSKGGNIHLTSIIQGGGKKNKKLGKDKLCLRQKGQAVNKHCDILDAIHKVACYIDGSLLHSQNGCQICSTELDKVPQWTQVQVCCHTMVKTWLEILVIDFTSSVKARHYREEEFYLVRFFAVVLPAHARIFSQM